MPDDPTREAPLTASVGDPLEEKRALDEQASAARQAVVEGEARERGRAQARLRDWASLLALPAAAAGGFALARWVGRRRGAGLPIPLVVMLAGGWALSRRGLPAG